MTIFRDVKVRTGEMRISSGFWWVQRREDGKCSVVEVDEIQNALTVEFTGDERLFDLEDILADFEFLALIPNPFD